ncbi:Uncharacterized protein HZ326_20034 [Fusarium oxysporum f. sp. albedinis]|nr:Uncharacterized protein HZ326_20034 [Fusarium oxysporum f. sp. albedinis]
MIHLMPQYTPSKNALCESCEPHNDFAQVQGTASATRPIRGIEWFMDERILVYSPSRMASGQLRPIILI